MPKQTSRRAVGPRIIATVALAIGLAGCTATTAPPLSTAPAVTVGDYRLVPGDKLRIVVYGERDLSGQFIVGSDGAINMPLIGAVPAAGLSPLQLQEKLVSGYAQGYLRDPQIVVDVTSLRPFYIMGEVNRPGEYPTTPGLTIAGAVAKAQGFSYRADQRRVIVRRNGEDREYSASPDLQEMVQPGDVIRVEERHF